MKVIALSDSHGCRKDLLDAVELARVDGPIDACVFLGDGLRDFEHVRPVLLAENPGIRIVAVRGNNDFGSDAAYVEVFTLGGCKFFAAHGHTYGVKYGLERLCFAAREQEAQVALFGHTHDSLIEPAYGCWFINPGAVCSRRVGRPAFARIRVDEQGVPRPDFVCWRS